MSGGIRSSADGAASKAGADGLVQCLYEAAAGRRPWLEFAALLARATHYDWVTICHEDAQRPQGTISAAYNVAADNLAAHACCFEADCPYGAYLKRIDPPAGDVRLLEDAALESEVARSAYYADYMAPLQMGISGHVLYTVLNSGDSRSSVLLQRRASSGASPDVAVELGHALMPHLQTAVQIHRRLVELEAAHSGLRAALDRLPHGVALLDATGRVLVLNRRASDALRADDGLRLEDKLLRGTGADSLELEQAIAAAVDTTHSAMGESPQDSDEESVGRESGDTAAAGAVLHVRRPSRRRPYELLVCSLEGARAVEPGLRPAAVAFISDPDNDSPLSTAEALRETYRLTRRESQVALGVLRGETIQEIATALELGRETVKTHLAGVYGKTGCRGQADLVRRLLLGVGALQAPLD